MLRRGDSPRLLWLLFCTLSVLGLGTVQSAVYRWVDTDGRVHFADRPPIREEAQPVIIKTTPGVRQAGSAPRLDAAQRRERQQKLLDAYADERKAKRIRRQQRDQERKQKEQRCVQARNRHTYYQQPGSFYDTKPDGSRRYYSKDEHEATLKQALEAVKYWCN